MIFDKTWGNANQQTTPYLLNLPGNQVFYKNDLPKDAINANRRPTLWTVILDVKQLQAMHGNMDGRYLLGNDIDASATSGWNNDQGFVPIGHEAAPFVGQFDGVKHTISRLSIQRPDENNVGLWGWNQGSVRRLVLQGANVLGRHATGALIGRLDGGLIDHVSTAGNVVGLLTTGSLVGMVRLGQISNAHSTSNVKSSDTADGLVGASFASEICNSGVQGSVAGGKDAGGLVGFIGTGAIRNSFAKATVKDGVNASGAVAGAMIGTQIDNVTAQAPASEKPLPRFGTRYGGSDAATDPHSTLLQEIASFADLEVSDLTPEILRVIGFTQ